uniref:TVP38/TMEM64 family membrane protein n=1 Tax=Syphacia muris TaxID=451379 RepID=A0A0N5AUR0_9BILA
MDWFLLRSGFSLSFYVFRDEHMFYVLLVYILIYLYKQIFAIPGSFFMNVCAGALFGRFLAMVIVCPLTSLGASGCYLLSSFAGKPIINKFFKKRFDSIKNLIKKNQSGLLYFLISSRVFPLTPHWLLNIFSPHLDIPLSKHALSVFIGLIPYNLICVEAGEMLGQIHHSSEILNWKVTMELAAIAFVIFGFSYYFRCKEHKVHKA